MSAELRSLIYSTLFELSSEPFNELQFQENLNQLFKGGNHFRELLHTSLNVFALERLVQYILTSVETRDEEINQEKKDDLTKPATASTNGPVNPGEVAGSTVETGRPPQDGSQASKKEEKKEDELDISPIDAFREPILREILEKLGKKIGELSEDIKNEDKRMIVHDTVLHLFQVFTTKEDIRKGVAKFTKPLLEKIQNLMEKPLFKHLLEQIDHTDLDRFSLASIKDSPVEFMDNLAHTILIPTFHNVIKDFDLDPIDVHVTDTSFSQTHLKLSQLHIHVPNPPDSFRIRTTTDMEFKQQAKFFSKAKVKVLTSISIKDLLLYVHSNFEYLENSFFINIQKKGAFEAKVNQLNLVISLLLDKTKEKIIFSGPNEQKCRISGFHIEFSSQMNEADLFNKFSKTFNEEITSSLNKAIEKQLVKVMKEVAVDLNDFLAIYYKNQEK